MNEKKSIYKSMKINYAVQIYFGITQMIEYSTSSLYNWFLIKFCVDKLTSDNYNAITKSLWQ